MLILASQSPRRQELLSGMGLSYRVLVSHADETPPVHATPAQAACAIALAKATAVRSLCAPSDYIIGADTSVVLEGQVFGKPRDETDAARMLRLLSGNVNTVITGVAVLHEEQRLTRSCLTKVYFRTLTEHEIQSYLSTGEPLDKAGAYGIQGRASWLVDHIDGDYYNVVGLPLAMLGEMLGEAGYDVWGGSSCAR